MFHSAVLVTPGPAHSRVEDRLIAIGTTASGRLAFVAFTLRPKGGATFIRPVSARYMHRKEARRYEERSSTEDR